LPACAGGAVSIDEVRSAEVKSAAEVGVSRSLNIALPPGLVDLGAALKLETAGKFWSAPLRANQETEYHLVLSYVNQEII